MIPATPRPDPCPRCGQRPQTLTCTCRGCPDLVRQCDCPDSADLNLAREGLCEGCAAAGCQETLAAFPRCRRLAPATPAG